MITENLFNLLYVFITTGYDVQSNFAGELVSDVWSESIWVVIVNDKQFFFSILNMLSWFVCALTRKSSKKYSLNTLKFLIQLMYPFFKVLSFLPLIATKLLIPHLLILVRKFMRVAWDRQTYIVCKTNTLLLLYVLRQSQKKRYYNRPCFGFIVIG